MALFGILIVLAGTSAAPFIYTLLLIRPSRAEPS